VENRPGEYNVFRASGRLSSSESGSAYEKSGAKAKSRGPALEHLAVWKHLQETSLLKMLTVAQKEQDGPFAFLDSPEGIVGTSDPGDIVSSDVSAFPPGKSQSEGPAGCNFAKQQRLSEAGEADPEVTEGAAGTRAMVEVAKEIVKI
jgi:hypothetical protein